MKKIKEHISNKCIKQCGCDFLVSREIHIMSGSHLRLIPALMDLWTSNMF